MNQSDSAKSSTGGKLEHTCSSSSLEPEQVAARAIGQRMAASRKSAGFTQRTAALEIGIHKNTIARHETGERPPDIHTLLRICSVYGVTAGDILYEPAGAGIKAPRASYRVGLPEEETVPVPIYDVEAAAGDGALVSDERVTGYYPLSAKLIQDKGWKVAQLGFITGRGDSMPGVIDDGGLVLINLGENRVQRAGIYLLMLDDHLVIKAVQINHRGDLVIHSTNNAYRDIEVPKAETDQLRIIGQAVWTPRFL